MRLLVFSPYYPPHIGGLETHSDEFNRHLAGKGVEIAVFTPRLPSNTVQTETVHGSVRVFRFPAFEPIHNYPVPKFWLPTFWRLLQEAARPRPDIIISRTRFFGTSFLALLYAKFRHIPIVHIEHGSDFARFNGRFKTSLGRSYDHVLGRLVLRGADRVVANSQASARFVRTLSERRDCDIIYRGVETEAILDTPADTDLRHRHADRTIIGFVGRLIDGKGVADLLSALSLLERDDIECLIIGDGPERKRLEALAKKPPLQGNVLFFGHQPAARAIALMKACDIIVNPSYTEGLPTSVTEAALCRKAVIATGVGGTPEIITGRGDGFLIEPGDVILLKEKLEILLDDPTLRGSFGEKAFQEVKEKFSWPHAAEKYIGIFREIHDTTGTTGKP